MMESGIGREREWNSVQLCLVIIIQTGTKWSSWLVGKTWILQRFSLSVTLHTEKQINSLFPTVE